MSGGFFSKVLLPVLQVGAGVGGSIVGGPAGIALAALPSALAVGQGIANKNPLQILSGAASGATAGIGSAIGGAAGALGSGASLGANVGASLGQQVAKTALSDVIGGAGALLNTGLGIYGSLKGPHQSVRDFGLNPASTNLGPTGGSHSSPLPGVPSISGTTLPQIPDYQFSMAPDKSAKLLELLGAYRT